MRRERGVSTAREGLHRGRYAAWEARHSGMGAAQERRHCCVPIVLFFFSDIF